MTGFVYAIEGGNGLVKIGFSRDPFRRLNKIRTDCPVTASLVGVIQATRKQEREAHALLSQWRHRGEWFFLCGPVADFVSMLPKPAPRVVVVDMEGWHPLAKWLHHADMTQDEAAKLMGITQGRVSQILRGSWPSRKVAAEIVKLTNGAVLPSHYAEFQPLARAAQ